MFNSARENKEESDYPHTAKAAQEFIKKVLESHWYLDPKQTLAFTGKKLELKSLIDEQSFLVLHEILLSHHKVLLSSKKEIPETRGADLLVDIFSDSIKNSGLSAQDLCLIVDKLDKFCFLIQAGQNLSNQINITLNGEKIEIAEINYRMTQIHSVFMGVYMERLKHHEQKEEYDTYYSEVNTTYETGRQELETIISEIEVKEDIDPKSTQKLREVRGFIPKEQPEEKAPKNPVAELTDLNSAFEETHKIAILNPLQKEKITEWINRIAEVKPPAPLTMNYELARRHHIVDVYLNNLWNKISKAEPLYQGRPLPKPGEKLLFVNKTENSKLYKKFSIVEDLKLCLMDDSLSSTQRLANFDRIFLANRAFLESSRRSASRLYKHSDGKKFVLQIGLPEIQPPQLSPKRMSGTKDS